MAAAVAGWNSGLTDLGPLARWQVLLSAYQGAWQRRHGLRGLLPAAAGGGPPAVVRGGHLLSLLRGAAPAEVAVHGGGGGASAAADPAAAALLEASGAYRSVGMYEVGYWWRSMGAPGLQSLLGAARLHASAASAVGI